MRVSELKAWLKSVEDEFDGSDPEIGIDVLAGKHIEFWSMNLDGAHFIKKDNCLSLFQVRLRSPIPRGALLKVKVPGLDSLECNLHDAIARFVEEYEVSGDLKAWQEQDIDMQEFTVAVIKDDVSKLSPADAHDKAKQALKDLILRVYGAETRAIYIKDYGLKPDVALQAAVSDCKIKIETYFDTKAPKVGKQSDEVVWTNGFHKS